MKISYFSFFVVCLIVLMSLDFLTTQYALKNNLGYEGNSLISNIVNNSYLFFLMKMIGTIGIIIMSKITLNLDKKMNSNYTKYGMNIILIFMSFVIINNLFVINANAETGSFLINEVTSQTGYSFSGGGSFAATTNFSQFQMYFTGYNSIQKIIATSANFNFPVSSATTTGSITSGGSGTFTVITDDGSNTITWYFDTGAIISAQNVILTYNNHNVVYDGTGGGVTCSCNYDTLASISASKPVSLQNSGVPHDLLQGITYTAQMSTYVVNTYSVSYFNSSGVNFFNLTVDKSASTVPTKIDVHNETQRLFQESAFNASNTFNYVHEYNTGLSAYMNITSGLYDFVQINTSGMTNPPTTPTPTATPLPTATKPSSGATIAFDHSDYYINDNVNISWYQSDSLYGDIFPKIINIYSNDVLKYTSSIPQSGNYIYTAEELGIIKAQIQEGFIFKTTIQEESVNVIPNGISYITFNNTQFTKVPFNITYHIGYSVSSYPATSIYISIKSKINGNTVASVFPVVFPDGSITIGDVNIIPEGSYTVQFFDSVKNTVLDTKSLTVIRKTDAIPTLGITSSNISIDKSYYFYGDYMTVSFRIDDTNWTNYSFKGIVNNTDVGITTKYIIKPFSSQIGSFDVLVNQNRAQLCEGSLNCYFETGNNTLTLVRYNTTSQSSISSISFIVASTTVDGWGIIIDNNSITTDDTFKIKVIVPSAHTGTFKIQDASYNVSAYSVYTINDIPEGTSIFTTQILRVNPNGVGYYNLNLYDASTGLIKMHIPITVTKVTTTKTTDIQSNTTDLLNSDYFVMTVTLIAFAAIGAYISAMIGAIVGFGAGFIVLSILGLVPLWGLMLFAILVITAFSLMVGGKFGNGGTD